MNHARFSKHSLARFMRRWHARMGVTAALFFILLIATGVALNHTERLGLARIAVHSDAMSRWYGLPVPPILAVYMAGEFIATPGEWLYHGRRLPDGGGGVMGAQRVANMLVVATPKTLNLYTPEGELVDILRTTALPPLPITALGRVARTMVLQTSAGLYGSTDGLDWQQIPNRGIDWAQTQTPDPHMIARIHQQIAPALPLERIVLDLHSGRLFGRYGPFLMDTAAFILLLLSMSGIWIQWRSWRHKHHRPHST